MCCTNTKNEYHIFFRYYRKHSESDIVQVNTSRGKIRAVKREALHSPASRKQMDEEIIGVFGRYKYPLSARFIAKLTNNTRSDVNTVLYRLFKQGEVNKHEMDPPLWSYVDVRDRKNVNNEAIGGDGEAAGAVAPPAQPQPLGHAEDAPGAE